MDDPKNQEAPKAEARPAAERPANPHETSFFAAAKGVLGSVYHAALADGHLAAAGRQGAAELGAALKAFPDSIQVDEPGTVFNPLYSDIAADQRAGIHGPALGRAALPPLSEIVKESGAHGQAAGRDAQVQMAEETQWVQRILEERKSQEGDDQNERAKGRVLPIEQRDQETGRGR